MKIKPDQERVRTLLTDTVTLLCKNGLQFQKNLKVQGLLGITLDDEDVFIVHINEMLGGFTSDKDSTAMSNASDIEEESSDTVSKRHHTEHGDGNTHNPPSPHTGRRTPNRKRRRSRQNSLDSPAARKKATPEHDSTLPIKQEPDDLIIIEDKDVKPEASAANETLDSNQDEGLDFALRNLPGDFVPYDHLNTDNRQLARPHIGQNLIPAVPGFPAVSPFITGIVQNALTATTSSSTGHDNSSLAEGSQNQSFHLTQPGTSAWGSETQSALQHWQQREQGAEGTPTQEAIVKSGRSGPLSSQCLRCEQFRMKSCVNQRRRRLLDHGVPKSDLPKLPSITAPPNFLCGKCCKRDHMMKRFANNESCDKSLLD